MAAASAPAFFIIGIEHRSGTNFLGDLLALHADCCRQQTIGEDYFLRHAHWLQKYAEGLHQSWNPQWRSSRKQEDVGAALGRGLLSLLDEQVDRPDRHLVTKTPCADRLGIFPWLFPDQPLLILIRDGRSVVESAVRSFGWSYYKATERWSHGARRILEFDRDHRGGMCRYLIVRYEDLVTGLEAELRRILAFLRLDPGRYDFAAAAALPVRGSSMLKSAGQPLHWTPVPKSVGFDPLKRASNWTTREHRRFFARAGHFQRLLGYGLEGSEPGGVWGGLLRSWIQRRQQRQIAKLGLRPFERQIVEQFHAVDAAGKARVLRSQAQMPAA